MPTISQAIEWFNHWKMPKPVTAEEVRTVQKRIQRRIEEDILNTFLNGEHQPHRPEPGTVTLDDRRPAPRNRKERRAAKHRRQA